MSRHVRGRAMCFAAGQIHGERAELFKNLVGWSQLHELDGKTGVLVLGPMGAGKSTSISIQLGAKLKKVKGDNHHEMVASDGATPKRSDGVVSQTLNIGVFVDRDSGWHYFDTAGLNESRGHDVHVWTKFSFATAIHKLNQILCTLVVIDFNASFTGRGQGMRDLAECLANSVGTGTTAEPFYHNMAFVITNAYSGGNKLSKDSVIKRAAAILKASSDQKTDRLKTLKREYPKQQSSGLKGLLRVEDETDHVLSDAINWEAVPENNLVKTELDAACAVIRLLQALADDSRVFLSFPDNPKACSEQRAQVNEIIRQTTPIGRDQLKSIVAARQTYNLDVLNILASIATEYMEMLQAYKRTLHDLHVVCEKKAHVLDGVDKDWQGAKDDMYKSEQMDIDDLMNKKNKAENEIRKLEASSSLVVFKTAEIRRVKTGPFMYGWRTVFGGLWAEEVYENGKADWYRDFQCRGMFFEHYVRENTGKNLKVFLKSKPDYDLNVDVVLRRYENELPSTKERIELVKKQVKDMDDDVAQRREKLLSLNATQTKADLVNYVLNSNEALSANFQKITDKRQMLIPETIKLGSVSLKPPTVWEVILGLAGLLSVTAHAQLDLPQGSKSTIK